MPLPDSVTSLGDLLEELTNLVTVVSRGAPGVPSDWVNENCGTCVYRVNSLCRLDPPENTGWEYKPSGYRIVQINLTYTDACSHHETA